MTHRRHRHHALLLGLAIAALGISGMQADAGARKPAAKPLAATKSTVTKTGSAAVAKPTTGEEETVRTQPVGVWTSGEQERACFRGRRKLWQDGQGWVVKRVNLCP